MPVARAIIPKSHSNPCDYLYEPDLLQAIVHKSVQQWHVHFYSVLLFK